MNIKKMALHNIIVNPVFKNINLSYGVFIKSIFWWIYQLSGFRLLYYKINPPADKPSTPPSTFVFWLLSSYILLFSLASYNYKNRIALVEKKTFISQSPDNTDAVNSVIAELVKVQRERCPVEPVLLIPSTVVRSLLFLEPERESFLSLLTNRGEKCREDIVRQFIANRTTEGIDLKKADLWGASFAGLNFSKANFSHSNLYSTDFSDATLLFTNFSGASLKKADFESANLQVASLKNTNLEGANFNKSDLSNAFLWGANLKEANFKDAVMEGTYLKNSRNLTLNQLLQAKTLYTAQLEPGTEETLRKINPNLFEKP